MHDFYSDDEGQIANDGHRYEELALGAWSARATLPKGLHLANFVTCTGTSITSSREPCSGYVQFTDSRWTRRVVRSLRKSNSRGSTEEQLQEPAAGEEAGSTGRHTGEERGATQRSPLRFQSRSDRTDGRHAKTRGLHLKTYIIVHIYAMWIIL